MNLAKKRKLVENGVVSPTEPTPLSQDDLRKVIESFTHEQLSKIVITASLRHPDVLESVRSIADHDLTQRNLYIRGLGGETTSEKLRQLFATYGDLVEAVAVTDKATGKGKGFGFVTYKHIDGAIRALKEPNKLIDGSMTVIQLSSTGIKNDTTVKASRKVYVGGNVPPEMGSERLLDHFSSYGEVEEGPVGFDKTTGKFRGFAFIIYKNVEGASACLLDPVKIIDGNELHCRLANSRKGDRSGGVAALSAATADKAQVQVQGSGDTVKQEVVNSNRQSSMQDSFHDGGPNGDSDYGWNVGGLGGGVGKGPLVGHSQPSRLNSGRLPSYCINANDAGALSAATTAKVQVQGSGDGVKQEVVNVSKLASMGLKIEIADQTCSKVYVGKVSPEMRRERLLAHFSSYGEVEEGPVGFDKTTGKFKGFAFIIYKNVEGASACLLDPIKNIDGHELHCRLAINRKGNHSAMVVSSAATTAKVPVQVQGSGDAVKQEVVNSSQQTSKQGSFASQFGGGELSNVSAYSDNSGAFGLPGGPGSGGQRLPLGHLQHPLNLNLGSGSGLSSSGFNVGGPGLSSNAGQTLSLGGGGTVAAVGLVLHILVPLVLAMVEHIVMVGHGQTLVSGFLVQAMVDQVIVRVLTIVCHLVLLLTNPNSNIKGVWTACSMWLTFVLLVVPGMQNIKSAT